jgi:hypothetical protein
MSDNVTYLGRKKKGDRLRLIVGTFDNDGEIETAGSAPEYRTFYLDDDGAAVSVVESSTKIPLVPERTDTFLFAADITLDNTYTIGQHMIVVDWGVNGEFNRSEFSRGEFNESKKHAFASFELVDGDGDERGTFVNLFSYDQHSGWHVVGQTSEGTISFGRQPA